MSKASETALKALKKLREQEGPNATFPSDTIWLFADEKPESALRPGAINWLRTSGFIETTGRMTNAVTPARAGSKTPEYRFGPQLNGTARQTVRLNQISSAFESDCVGNLRVSSEA